MTVQYGAILSEGGDAREAARLCAAANPPGIMPRKRGKIAGLSDRQPPMSRVYGAYFRAEFSRVWNHKRRRFGHASSGKRLGKTKCLYEHDNAALQRRSI